MNFKNILLNVIVFLALIGPTFLAVIQIKSYIWPWRQDLAPKVTVTCVKGDNPGAKVEVEGPKMPTVAHTELTNIVSGIKPLAGLAERETDLVGFSYQPLPPGIYKLTAVEVVGGIQNPKPGHMLFIKIFTVQECKGG